MRTDIETPAQARQRRAGLAGDVDFTMMYVAHDAFNRDLARLLPAAEAGQALSPAAAETWRTFRSQLHSHHSAEDTGLWPQLRAVVTDPAEIRVLDDMEREHASLDPCLDQIDAGIAARDEDTVVRELTALATGLSEHMRHEEDAALPLLERRLGQAGWDAFGKHIRSELGGLKGAARYLPWVLEDADPTYAAALLGVLPTPARMFYRRLWEPKYRKTERLG